MRMATNDSQHAPEAFADVINQFRQVVLQARTSMNIDIADLWNMDQTMVHFDSPTRRTNNTIGESRIRISNTGVSRKGFTVALCVSAAGEKMPAFIIFKERSGEIPGRVRRSLTIPNNVVVAASLNGWMTTPLLHMWISNVFSHNAHNRSILLLDKYAPHHTRETAVLLNQLGSTPLPIPAGNLLFNFS